MAASPIKQAYGTNTTITITQSSLGNGSARGSTAISNAVDLFDSAFVAGHFKTGASGVSATGSVTLYVAGSNDNGSTFTDNAPATDAAFTPTSPPNLFRLGSFNANANATAYPFGPFDVAQAFGGVLPDHWTVVVVNNTGSTSDTTAGNHTMTYEGVYYNVG